MKSVISRILKRSFPIIRTGLPNRADREPQFSEADRVDPGAAAMRLAADILALIYIGIIATVASVTGAFYVLFPELAALAWNVMEQPRGRWAGSPLLLALTPPLTGLIGTVVTRTMPYGFASVLITVAACVAIIKALRSPVAPAISAGLLPLVLGVTSWWYPPGVLFGTTLLAAISIPWKRYATSFPASALNSDDDQSIDPSCDTSSSDASQPPEAPPAIAARYHMLALLVFVAIAVGVVKLTGMRFILFPPLVVILYEMLSLPEHCPWIGRPVGLPIACFLAAAGGYFFRVHVTIAPLAAMLSMAWGGAVLRTFDIHLPPALAVALLPMVMAHPTVAYPFAVGLGTTLASAWFALFEKWRVSRLHTTSTRSPAASAPDVVV
jgi:hypothetical protein